MAFLPGKFGRFTAGSITASGAFRWNVGFRRERLDVTTFESAVGITGVNVHSDGLTGVLDTTFQVECYVSTTTYNLFFPDAVVTSSLYFNKNVPIGYVGILADVLEFNPNVSVRDRAMATVQLQSNGIVNPAVP